MGKSTVLPGDFPRNRLLKSPQQWNQRPVVGVGRVAQWAVASGSVHAQRID